MTVTSTLKFKEKKKQLKRFNLENFKVGAFSPLGKV
jgi:hypothetical protein